MSSLFQHNIKILEKHYYMFNFFSKTNKKNNTEETRDDILCSVNIELAHDGTIGIRYFWPKFTEKNDQHIYNIAHDFGILLYMINSGLLEKDMVETLAHTKDKDNVFDQQFTTYVLREWLKAVDSSTNNNPIVSPSNVFGQYKQ